MKIVPLAQLQAPDEGVRRFSPLGLSMAGMLTAEAAAEHQQHTITSAELVEAVPGETRASFERLRTLHSHGILCYDAFTAVVDLAPLVADLALRERFLAFYANEVPVIDRDGSEQLVRTNAVGQLVETLKQENLRLGDWPPSEQFQGGFGQLLRWARRHDLLSGQRARQSEQWLQRARNRIAHPDGHHVLTPVTSAREIHDLAEIINRLWGSRTAGGRLYPAPIQREVLALGVEEDGAGSICLAQALGDYGSLLHATVLLVRGVPGDDLFEFDVRYENTRFPAQLLWGPGSYPDALSWLAQHEPRSDTVEYLDRWFVIRRAEGRTELPCRLEVVAGRPEQERSGHWSLVRADSPNDAFIHVKYEHQPFCGPCQSCAADGIAAGAWADLITVLGERGVEITPVVAPEARMPGRWRT